MGFVKAVKYQHKLRIGLAAPTGGGKTYTALALACEIARREGGRVAVIDSEHGTAKLYAEVFDFDTMELQSFAPDRYVEAIHEAEREGYSVIVVDGATQAWAGKDGALEQVDKKAGQTGNQFTAWRDVTPQHNRLVESMTGCKTHIIVTMRSKMAYAMQEIEDRGRKRTVVEKLGLQPVQREGMEYEFDVFADLDTANVLSISKTRCSALNGYSVLKPGAELATILFEWAQGAEAPPAPVQEAPQERPAPARDGTAGDGAAPTSPAPSPTRDQLGTFAKPDGTLNQVAFAGELTRRKLTVRDLVGIAPENAGGNGVDIKAWLRDNPRFTLLDLASRAECNRYGHDEPVANAEAEAECPRCHWIFEDEAEATEPVQEGLAV